MRISDWSSDVCSSDLRELHAYLVGAMSAEERQKAGTVNAIFNLIAQDRAGLDPHPRPVALQFFCHVHRDLRHRAIADLRRRHANRHRIVSADLQPGRKRSEEHTSELQSIMRISYAVFCLK